MAKTEPQRLGPGIYKDDEGLIIDVPELVEHFDLPNTQASRERCLRVAMRAAKQLFPELNRIVVRREGSTLRVSRL